MKKWSGVTSNQGKYFMTARHLGEEFEDNFLISLIKQPFSLHFVI